MYSIKKNICSFLIPDSGTTIQPSNSGSCNISSHTSVGTGSINSSTSGVPTIDSPIKNLNSSIPFIDLTNDSPTKLSPSTAATTVTTTSTTDTAVATNTTPNTTTTITLPSLDDSSSKDKLSSVKIAPSGYFSTIQTSVPTPTPAVTTDPNNLLNADKDNITLSRSSNNNNNNNNARLLAASLVADLVCRICGRLSQQPQLEPDKRTMNANVLVECIQCGSLYHQLCHQPMILMSTSKQHWLCMHCCRPTTDSVSISTSVIDMTPSSSSNSTESTTTVVSSKLIRSHSIVSSSDVTIISANISTSGSPSSSSPSTDSTHHQSLIVPNPVQLSLDSSSLSTTSTAFVSSSSFSPTNPPTTVTVGARKRKPAFTSPLSGIPRKLKDEHA
ncbi:unnamed protein product [Trichobilharzia regenti]|nr:unnamed protein product [Trichobilharzia regenti]